MPNPISGATQTPSANIQPPRSQSEAAAREQPDSVQQQREPQPQQRAQAPREDERPESRRPDADDRVGTNIDIKA